MKKRPQNRLTKCLKQKTNTLIEKTLLFQKKLINSYDKNATEPSYKMPEAKRRNTHWKNNSDWKKLKFK